MSKRFHTGKGPSQRQLRVAELVRRALADVFAQGIPADPDLPQMSITVSEVQLSSDLKRATVYVLPLGGARAAEIIDVLNREQSIIRKSLNRSVYLKFSPRLVFVLDTAFDRMDEMRRLLDLDDVKRDLARQSTPHEAGVG